MTVDPSLVWHYCPSHSFEGIVRSGQIYLSDPRFMNDFQELEYATRLIKDVVASELGSAEANQLLTGFDKHLTLVFCFSEGPDLLSQWRGYADDGHGFALGFATRAMCKLRGIQAPSLEAREGLPGEDGVDPTISFLGPRFDPVVYQVEEQKDIIKGICDDYRTDIREVDERQNAIRKKLLISAPFIKQEGYSEESEWRLTSAHLSLDGGRTFKHLRHPGTLVRRSAVVRYDARHLHGASEESIGYYPVLQHVRLGPRNRSFPQDVREFIQRSQSAWGYIEVSRSSTSYGGY